MTEPVEYLNQKVKKYSQLTQTPIIFCVKETLRCSAIQHLSHDKIIYFKNHVNVTDVLNLIKNQ